MRQKTAERLEAERLRREEGLSYNEIAARTGLSKSTLSHWLRDIVLEPEHAARLQERLAANRQTFAARAWPINRNRNSQARASAYSAGIQAAAQVPDLKAVHELAFAMLYLGEGTKGGNAVILASVTPDILKYSLWVLRDIYLVHERDISCRLHLVEAAVQREPEIRSWWINQLQVPSAQFKSTTYDRRRREVDLTEDYHGVCEVVCCDTYLHQRVLAVGQSYVRSRLSIDTTKEPAGGVPAG